MIPLNRIAARIICRYNRVVDIAFDPVKDAVNRRKHGLSLAFGVRVFDDTHHLLIPSLRLIDGEERFKVIGLVDGKLHTAVHVRRAGVVRFISVRRSNDGERRLYDHS